MAGFRGVSEEGLKEGSLQGCNYSLQTPRSCQTNVNSRFREPLPTKENQTFRPFFLYVTHFYMYVGPKQCLILI